jgi:hypothetical protein
MQRSLVFIGLMMAGLLLYSTWFGMKADRYDETVLPYLESVLPKLTSWQYSQLKPFLSPEAQVEYEAETGQAIFQSFKKLGALESAAKARYMGVHSGNSEALGDIEIIAYQLPLQFESGPALIKFKLASDGERYYIHQFGIQSEIFADPASSSQ